MPCSLKFLLFDVLIQNTATPAIFDGFMDIEHSFFCGFALSNNTKIMAPGDLGY